MRLLYTCIVRLYGLLIRLYAPFNSKAKLWIDGRKTLFERLSKTDIAEHNVVWFHCASLGEFEQGRTVIEKFRKEQPQYKILLTFFSPSGYEVRKNYIEADYIYYLPLDTISNARKFIKMVRPTLVFFVKYEFWYNYIKVLSDESIPFFYISAIFRPGQVFFRTYGSWFRHQIKKATHFFVQNESSAKLLTSIGIHKFTLSGDTRFDRVYAITQQATRNSIVENFCNGHRIILLGSSWQEDEKLVQQVLLALPEDIKIIIAPHETKISRVNEIKEQFSAITFSELSLDTTLDNKVLCIDTIGILSSLYAYANIAIIGGGFGKGIHNTLEAATFGIPIVFGPNYSKFKEAVDLLNLQAAFSINNAKDLTEILERLLSNTEFYTNASHGAKNYVGKNIGATEIIMNGIKPYLNKSVISDAKS
jgi:3-deoxy-D-manno-octulosonic-acid transferase